MHLLLIRLLLASRKTLGLWAILLDLETCLNFGDITNGTAMSLMSI